HYTVDEHLLRAVGGLSDLEAGRMPEHQQLVDEILPTIVNRKVLYLGLFLHDIAKGRKEDHSRAGMEVARSLCPRLGFTPGETESVAWLVEHHLTMSSFAQSRDLSDRVTIENFAAIVQTMERLKMLFVLTVCDINAVGPGVLDAWKAQLLRVLYWETEVVLGGGHSAVDRKSRVAAAKAELRAALPEWSDEAFDAYAKRHYPAYWLKVDVARKLRHAELLRQMNGASAPLATAVELDRTRGAVELTVVAPDNPRLLSIIAGGCAAGGANIVDAHIFTTADGLALDTIFFSRAFDFDEDEMRRAGRIADLIAKALRGEVVVSEELRARAKAHLPTDAFSVAPEVVVDNSLSNVYTVIEVSGLDREGLLFELTNAISRLNLNIASAHIVTFGERAVDAFYVTDLTGAKIASPQRQATIKRQLLDVFRGPGARGARTPAAAAT
ncbi:MAG: ACT domain-containing protein, partial [Methylocystis silviterrae]